MWQNSPGMIGLRIRSQILYAGKEIQLQTKDKNKRKTNSGDSYISKIPKFKKSPSSIFLVHCHLETFPKFCRFWINKPPLRRKTEIHLYFGDLNILEGMYAAQQIKMVSIIQIQENTEKTPLLTVLTGLKHEKINTNWPPIMTTSPPPLLNNSNLT